MNIFVLETEYNITYVLGSVGICRCVKIRLSQRDTIKLKVKHVHTVNINFVFLLFSYTRTSTFSMLFAFIAADRPRSSNKFSVLYYLKLFLTKVSMFINTAFSYRFIDWFVPFRVCFLLFSSVGFRTTYMHIIWDKRVLYPISCLLLLYR